MRSCVRRADLGGQIERPEADPLPGERLEASLLALDNADGALDDQTRLAEDAKLISCLKVFPTRQSSKTPGRCLVESLSAPWFPIVTLEKLVIAQCVRHRGTDRSF